MLKNYLMIAARLIKKNKLFSFINIFGLAIGLATCLLIILWINDELSYDRFHQNGDHIYTIVCSDLLADDKFAVTTPALAPALEQEFPEVVAATRYYEPGNIVVKYGDKKSLEDDVAFVDPQFLTMFSFPPIKGNPQTALSAPKSTVLTESQAKKYFGTEDPIGKTLTVAGRFDFKVTGLVEDPPLNSHFRFVMLVPVDFLEEFGWNLEQWDRFFIGTYVQLHPESPVIEKDRLSAYIHTKVEDSENLELFLFPVKDIHLYASDIGAMGRTGDIKNVYLFSIISLFVLLIACINFMNLSTTQSGKRIKEIGMRKVVGASRKDIIKQFYGESILMTFVALALAFILIELFLPVFNGLSGKQLRLDFSGNYGFFLVVLGIVFTTGFISGSYPALLLSSFKPVVMFRGKRASGSHFQSFSRKFLVVAQFAISIILIIGTVIVYAQMDFLRHRKLGFDHERIVSMELTQNLRQKYDVMKTDLLNLSYVSHVTSASKRPFTHISSTDWRSPDNTRYVRLAFTDVGYDYLETFGLELAEGRFFSKEYSLDENNYILNETAVRQMGFANPEGHEIEVFDNRGVVIGVVKDYHYESLHSPIGPLVLRFAEEGQNYLYAKIKPTNIEKALKDFEGIWNYLELDYPFNYRFFDSDFDGMYRVENRFKKILGYFAMFAVFISCLGLFGLACYLTEQRTKEIGIRKVLGASIPRLILMFSKEFAKWVIVANLIAWPVAYFAMSKWLQGFAYRTGIQVWIFLFSSLLALLVALSTVTIHTTKAALANPSDSLKYE
ncbi:MAG: ABC transporter permease [Candidatus Aminicenantes bacterium]|nr:MAG: ABC transporter permease [Candidatus Aminicenantes bacterium]